MIYTDQGGIFINRQQLACNRVYWLYELRIFAFGHFQNYFQTFCLLRRCFQKRYIKKLHITNMFVTKTYLFYFFAEKVGRTHLRKDGPTFRPTFWRKDLKLLPAAS